MKVFIKPKPCPFCGEEMVREGEMYFNRGYWKHPEYPDSDCILAWIDSENMCVAFNDGKETEMWNRRTEVVRKGE